MHLPTTIEQQRTHRPVSLLYVHVSLSNVLLYICVLKESLESAEEHVLLCISKQMVNLYLFQCGDRAAVKYAIAGGSNRLPLILSVNLHSLHFGIQGSL